ncbi:hypothetical protein JAAARDRAFT_168836 [Jaapia argillacea MUCL 33604]|uniref:H/ACA ribonucleoprotein complex non-core subunit NAF1 n=1 Tax=Jaapia argillacea MUCL 33604 TaxID=933084 RepID=A0A067Q8C7_9AGAM|nr:hypothetical protein JAAARDRAFT_168836 [Jaapia argillacea MUCL 33604]
MWNASAESDFKVPSSIPQDLLLIHDLVGHVPVPVRPTSKTEDDDCIDSSDDGTSDTDSEDEVLANLSLEGREVDSAGSSRPGSRPASESESDSDSDGSASDQEDHREATNNDGKPRIDDVEDDNEEQGTSFASAANVKTKNEISDLDVVVPDIAEVGPDEQLENVGTVMSISDDVVIIQGSAAHSAQNAHERALDADTLLVFEDRKVLGYVYETFGPTYQPLYQVKFPATYPIDREKVQLSRPVFHVPHRSRFVFTSQLRHIKGSDASNAHDEEPGADELEFSDDEQEAAHKRQLKEKRGHSRATSVVSSRHTTPIPSQMHDQEMTADSFYGANPYDEHGPYDMDMGAGPSRPAPLPYDDPYSDEYNFGPPAPDAEKSNAPSGLSSSDRSTIHDSVPVDQHMGRGRGRGRGRGGSRGGRDSADHGGRRDRGRHSRGRGRGRPPSGHIDEGYNHQMAPPTNQPPNDPVYDYPQYQGNASYAQPPGAEAWSYRQYSQQTPYQFSFAYPAQQQQQYVQPHINPRFASAYGFDLAALQGQQFPQYGAYGPNPNGWNAGGTH